MLKKLKDVYCENKGQKKKSLFKLIIILRKLYDSGLSYCNYIIVITQREL